MDEVEKMKLDSKNMWLKATEHGGRFLLPRRFSKGNPKQDALYDAAKWLVSEGYARWLSPSDDMRPGIELTTRPWR